MKILTIIVSYNFMPWIDKCLGSMIQSGYPTDILVLDNDSKDETVKTIRERYPQVRLIENHANLGFGKANNIGIAGEGTRDIGLAAGNALLVRSMIRSDIMDAIEDAGAAIAATEAMAYQVVDTDD